MEDEAFKEAEACKEAGSGNGVLKAYGLNHPYKALWSIYNTGIRIGYGRWPQFCGSFGP